MSYIIVDDKGVLNMIELECKTDGCDAVIPCDEGVVSVKCGICSMYNADACERETMMFDYFN